VKLITNKLIARWNVEWRKTVTFYAE